MAATKSIARTLTRDVGPLSFRAAVVPSTLDAEKRTVQVVWTTGASVLRGTWDPYWEQLSLDPQHVRMERLQSGTAPLLNAHNAYDIDDVIGVVESAQLEPGRGTAVVRFDKGEEGDEAFRKVADGILRNLSVGYLTYRAVQVEGGDDTTPVYRAVDWEPYEISLVPINADAGAVTRSAGATVKCEFTQEKKDMGDETHEAAPQAQTAEQARAAAAEQARAAEAAAQTRAAQEQVRAEQARAEQARADARAQELASIAVAAERDRVLGIQRIGQALKRPETEIREAVANSTSLESFRAAAVDRHAEAETLPFDRRDPRVQVGESLTRAGAQEGVRNALMHRCNPTAVKLEDAGRQYRGLSLMEMARAFLEAHGVRTVGIGKLDLAGLALGLDTRAGTHSTSDFPLILADVAGKTLRRAYEEAPQTFQAWGRRVTLPDFKQVKRTQLGEAPALTKVLEGGEFTRGTIGEGREAYQLSTYGKVFTITRQVLINDDMDAFSRVPQMFGRSARDLESDVVYSHFGGNPVMGDGTTLFHANHLNLGTGAIAIPSLGAGRQAMRKQKGLDKKQRINVQARNLLVPAALETAAEQFVSTQLLANAANNINVFAGRLQVIAEPRLDDVSALEWYLTADPASIDTLEYGYLEGEDGPFIENRIGFDVDGLELKARHDFAAKVIDWRGFYKSSGA